MERTLAVLFGPEGPAHRRAIQGQLVSEGFDVVAETEIEGPKLVDAGLNLALILGDDSAADCMEDDLFHVALVLQKPGAVQAWQTLFKSTSLTSLYPSLQMYASPNLAAANVSIESIFGKEATQSSTSPRSAKASPALNKSNPIFALSNLAHTTPPTTTRQVSATIERALQKLELDEKNKAEAAERANAAEKRVFSYTPRQSPVTPKEPTISREEDKSSTIVSSGNNSIVEEDLEQDPPSPVSMMLSRPQVKNRLGSSVSNSSIPATPSSRSRPPSSLQSPSTPSILPRLTKTAALRMGIPLPPPPATVRNRSGSGSSGMMANNRGSIYLSGFPKQQPSDAQMSRAALIRAGLPIEPITAASRRTSVVPSASEHDSNAGHKRRESNPPPQVRPPAITPRANRSSMLRAGVDLPPPTIAPRASSVIGLSPPSYPRSTSSLSTNRPVTPKQPTFTPRPNKASELRAARRVSAGPASTPVLGANRLPTSRPSSSLSQSTGACSSYPTIAFGTRVSTGRTPIPRDQLSLPSPRSPGARPLSSLSSNGTRLASSSRRPTADERAEWERLTRQGATNHLSETPMPTPTLTGRASFARLK